jgi:hypothetical protein
MKKKVIIKVFIAIGIILLIIGILDAISLFGESFPAFYIFLLVGILFIVIPALSLDVWISAFTYSVWVYL